MPPDGIDDIDNEADDFLGDRQGDLDNAKDAGKEGGEAYQSGEQAKKDLEDPDQDTGDKAKNVADGTSDALDSAGNALEALGIDDPGLGSLADAIDGATDDLFGPGAPDRLPPVKYALYFGEKKALDALGEGLFADGLEAADGLVGKMTDAMGVSSYVGSDAVSSIAEKHSPFVDEEALANEQSQWKVVRVWWEEGLSELFRCELLLATRETRNEQLEMQLAATDPGGSLVDQITAPVKNAIALGKAIENTVDKAKGIAEDVVGIAKDFADDPGATAKALAGDAMDALAPDESSGTEQPVYINVPIDPGLYLGETCSMRVTRQLDTTVYSERWLTGIVVELDDLGVYRGPPGGADIGDRFLRIVVQPSLARLRLRRDCRVFQDMSALEVVRDVFRSAGVYGFLPDLPGVGAVTDAIGDLVEKVPLVGGAASDALSGQFIKMVPPPDTTEDEWTKRRELCIQYNETDLDFVRRLLEEEGIHFCFEHRRGFERIVFIHDPTNADEAPTVDGRPVPYFWPTLFPTSIPKVETIRRVGEQRTLRSGKVTLRDFNFSNAALMSTSIESTENLPAPETYSAERYEYPGSLLYQYEEADEKIHYRDYQADKEDRDIAKLRLEEAMTRARFVRLESDVIGVEAGRAIKMRGYLFQDVRPDLFGARADVLLVRRMRCVGAGGGPTIVYGGAHTPELDDKTPEYENDVWAQWVNVGARERTPCRPLRRTAKPRITGLQTATVVDDDGSHSEDEEAFVDHPTLCRIRVRFHWDRRGEVPLGIDLPLIDLGKTCWVRVAHAWAGDDFGVQFVPRIGSEVLVAFENGDPDRPLVVGCLYDGEHPLPVDAPEKSTIHTRTSPWDDDDGKESHLRFDDAKKESEKVELKAGRFLVEEVRTCHEVRVGHDQKSAVERHQGKLVEGKQSVAVVGNRTKTVKCDEEVKVDGNRTRRVGGDEEVRIERERKEEIGGVEAREVDGDRTLTIHGDRKTTIGKKGSEPVQDVHEIKKGNKTDTIDGVLKVRADTLSIGGKGADAVETGLTASKEEDGHALKVGSKKDVSITAQEEVKVQSEKESVEIHGHDQLQLEAPGSIAGCYENGYLVLTSGTRVEIVSETGTIDIKPDMIDMTAFGEPRNAMAIVRKPVVRLSGNKVIITMVEEVDLSGAAVKIG